MARIIIDEDGTKRYLNDQGQLHREDGPAVISCDGYKHWYRQGKWYGTYLLTGAYVMGSYDPTDIMTVHTYSPTGINSRRRNSAGEHKIWPEL